MVIHDREFQVIFPPKTLSCLFPYVFHSQAIHYQAIFYAFTLERPNDLRYNHILYRATIKTQPP